MKKLLLISFFAAINLIVQSQHYLGFKANGGISRIKDDLSLSNGTLTVQLAPTGNGGIFYYLKISENSLIGTELIFNQIESKRKIVSQNMAGTIEMNTDEHISYLALPVYYGLKLNKITTSAGFQISYLLASRGHSKIKITDPSLIPSEITYDELNIDNYDFGFRAGIAFDLTDRLSIEGAYYHGINNILGCDGRSDVHWKVQQFSFGLRYTIWIKSN